MNKQNKLNITIFLFLAFLVQAFSPFSARAVGDGFPRRANYFLKWQITDEEARILAKYDLLILDMEIQARQPEIIRKIRELNKKIIILAYITAQEIRVDALGGWSIMRDRLARGVSDGMYLRNTSGECLSWWNGTRLLNVTNRVEGENIWNEYLPNFVMREILATRLWDGVFYDNAWDNVTHFAGEDVDLNYDGKRDVDVDGLWRDGMRKIYTETRRLTKNKYIIVANGNTREYTRELNGKMIENFLPVNWPSTMNTYVANSNTENLPKVNIINANTGNSGKLDDYRRMRFGLASTLLSDGYFSFDHGDSDHGQTWWYDEYDVDLGKSATEATSVASGEVAAGKFSAGIWRRDFENGLAVINSGDEGGQIDLGADYEKISGKQDQVVNNGSIISELDLPANDGVILLKTLSTLSDVIFKNGDFVRFYQADGDRARNGFYLFADKYRGGDLVGYVDLNGDGERETITVTRNRITVWRANGRLFAKIYPYTSNYSGTLRLAVGDLNKDGRAEIYVAPSADHAGALKVFSLYGETILEDWYPKGEKYRGGMSVAVAENSIGEKFLVVGAGKNSEPRVSIFDSQYKLVNEWLAFEKKFLGGVNVATGDVDGLAGDEVVVSSGRGRTPTVRTFSIDGKTVVDEFGPGSVSPDSIDTLDVNFDGKDEILTFGAGF